MTAQVLRYAAFTVDGQGGNPAGLVLDARGLDATQMQAIAADVGYSETAFLVAEAGRVQRVRRALLLAETGSAVLRACDHCRGGCSRRALTGSRAHLPHTSRLRQHHDFCRTTAVRLWQS